MSAGPPGCMVCPVEPALDRSAHRLHRFGEGSFGRLRAFSITFAFDSLVAGFAIIRVRSVWLRLLILLVAAAGRVIASNCQDGTCDTLGGQGHGLLSGTPSGETSACRPLEFIADHDPKSSLVGARRRRTGRARGAYGADAS